MRIVFVGASKFGLRCLEDIAGMKDCPVVGAVTAPRTFAISYRPEGVTNVLHADVEVFCAANQIECATLTQGMNDPALRERVAGWRPDVFVVVGWYHMVPKSWRDLAPAYGMHASLLPDYSGGAPLVWAIINGEKRTGITLFQLGDGVDNGPILGQLPVDIHDDDTIATVYARVEELGRELLRRHLPQLAAGTAVLTVQDERKRRIVPQRGPEDGRIDWSQPASRVHDFIRAQTRPYPGAFSHAQGERVTLWASRKPATAPSLASLAPGELLLEGGRVLVGCGGSTVLELTRMTAGGDDLDAAEWFARGSARAQPIRSLE
jgi:methionyl-tRNA formyltransferase